MEMCIEYHWLQSPTNGVIKRERKSIRGFVIDFLWLKVDSDKSALDIGSISAALSCMVRVPPRLSFPTAAGDRAYIGHC